MAEEEKKEGYDHKEEAEEEEKKEEKAEDKTSADMVTKAHIAAERLEKANENMIKIAERLEKLAVNDALGGKSEGGKLGLSHEEKEEKKAIKAAEDMMGGKLNPFSGAFGDDK